MQMKMPKFQLAHRGSTLASEPRSSLHMRRYIRLLRLQSAQLLLASIFTRLLSVWRFCSARSAAGLGRRDIVANALVGSRWRRSSCKGLAADGKCECEGGVLRERACWCWISIFSAPKAIGFQTHGLARRQSH